MSEAACLVGLCSPEKVGNSRSPNVEPEEQSSYTAHTLAVPF